MGTDPLLIALLRGAGGGVACMVRGPCCGGAALASCCGTKISTVFLAATKSRTLEPLAFDEYCRFDTSAFF